MEIGSRGIKEEVMFEPSVEVKQLPRHIVRARRVFHSHELILMHRGEEVVRFWLICQNSVAGDRKYSS